MGTVVVAAVVLGALAGAFVVPFWDAMRPFLATLWEMLTWALLLGLFGGLVALIVWAAPVATASSLAWLLERDGREDAEQ